MKRVWILVGLACLLTGLPLRTLAAGPTVEAKSAVLMELSTGTVLHEHNSHEQLVRAITDRPYRGTKPFNGCEAASRKRKNARAVAKPPGLPDSIGFPATKQGGRKDARNASVPSFTERAKPQTRVWARRPSAGRGEVGVQRESRGDRCGVPPDSLWPERSGAPESVPYANRESKKHGFARAANGYPSGPSGHLPSAEGRQVKESIEVLRNSTPMPMGTIPHSPSVTAPLCKGSLLRENKKKG